MRIRRYAPSLAAVLGLVAVLASGAACSTPAEDEDGASAAAVSEAEASAVLDVHGLDVWARPLAAPSLVVTTAGRAVRIAKPAEGVTRVLLGRAGTYALRLAASDHVPFEVTVDWDGRELTTRDGSVASDGGRSGVTLARGEATVAGRRLPDHHLFLGLRHAWFSAQARAPRDGNAVELLFDGEEAFRAIDVSVRGAQRSVLVSTWWWDSNFELVRDTPLASTRDRKKNTILSVLDATPAQKRILVGQLLGSVSLVDWLTTDSELRSRVGDPRLQFMREGNDTRGRFRFDVLPVRFGDRVRGSGGLEGLSTPGEEAPIPSTVPGHDVDLTTFLPGVDLASIHQKFFVVDGRTAFVGGLNMRETDWDSSKHEVYDVRRLPFSATQSQREAAVDKTCPPDGTGSPPITCTPPTPGPRKDYMLRIDGPAVADVEDEFVSRWNALIARRVADATRREPMAAPASATPASQGDVAVQITTTAPREAHGIAETWFNAIRNAERFVYVEDQYFRMPMLHEALVKRMDDKPELRLVVITRPVTRMDPGCAPTRQAHDLFASRYPNRFLYVTTKAFDPVGGRYDGYAEIFLHSKMLVVDDVFMSVGSANKNNRGLVYELEMNAAVLDRTFVTAARRRMLRAVHPGVPETDEVATWFASLREVAADNARVFTRNQDPENPVERPRGFLHTLELPGSCAFPDVGPDET